MCKAQDAVNAWYAEQRRLKNKNKNKKNKSPRTRNKSKCKNTERVSYREYLSSKRWRAKRRKALDHYGCVCSRCGSDELLQVHHKTYKRLGHELMSDLEILCRNCHMAEHQHEKPWIKDSLTEEFISIYGVRIQDWSS
jgi:5-methylcytosine-specific restriction endonuclease McrA